MSPFIDAWGQYYDVMNHLAEGQLALKLRNMQITW